MLRTNLTFYVLTIKRALRDWGFGKNTEKADAWVDSLSNEKSIQRRFKAFKLIDEDWHRVIFSDEVELNRCGSDLGLWAWEKKNRS